MRTPRLCAAARGQRSGFTIIESIFAVSVLGIVGVGMLGTLGVSVRAGNANRGREAARVAAQAQLERVLAWPDYTTVKTQFDGVLFPAGTLATLDAKNKLAEMIPLDGSTIASVDASEVLPGRITVDDTTPELLLVTSQVIWDSPGVGRNTIEISVQLADPEWTVTLSAAAPLGP